MCMTRVSVLLMYNKTKQNGYLHIKILSGFLHNRESLVPWVVLHLKQQLIVKCKCYAYELFTK